MQEWNHYKNVRVEIVPALDPLKTVDIIENKSSIADTISIIADIIFPRVHPVSIKNPRSSENCLRPHLVFTNGRNIFHLVYDCSFRSNGCDEQIYSDNSFSLLVGRHHRSSIQSPRAGFHDRTQHSRTTLCFLLHDLKKPCAPEEVPKIVLSHPEVTTAEQLQDLTDSTGIRLCSE